MICAVNAAAIKSEVHALATSLQSLQAELGRLHGAKGQEVFVTRMSRFAQHADREIAILNQQFVDMMNAYGMSLHMCMCMCIMMCCRINSKIFRRRS